ncbi:MAG: caspase family protein [Planctomycetes bacterium]|nr:caspase family protein [Planctomycetota bacterium]
MSQVVQAKCPHCQDVLRIPADWVGKAMRCKHCKQTFQAKAAAAVPVSAPAGASSKPSAPVPVAQPAKASPILVAQPAKGGAPPSSHNPFGFDADEPAPPSSPPSTPRSRGRGAGMLLLVIMFFLLFLVGAGGAGYVVYRALNDPPTRDAKQLSKNEPKGEHAPVKPKTGPDNPKGIDKKNPSTIDDNGKKTPPNDPMEIPDPPKPDPPKKKKELPKLDPKDLVKKKDEPKKPVFSDGAFPRRALLINVNNFMFYDTVHYGSDAKSVSRDYPGSSTSVLRDRLMNSPMNFPATQIYELSDGTPPGKPTKAHSTHKSVLEATIKDFLETSRKQDRILVLFSGHAASIEDKSYLVPPDSNIKQVDTLIPLKWVYDQLSACKAQQKILILDVFRFSPSRGIEVASTGEGEDGAMPEGFDKDVLSPPAGVQVWCACQKEQSSIELEAGGAFMQALCKSLQGGSEAEIKGIPDPTQPIPIDLVVEAVNKHLKGLVAPTKRTQVSRLTGKPSADMVPYDRDESLAALISLKPPQIAGGDAASVAQVDSILEFFRDLAPVREARAADRSLLDPRKLRGFGAKTLDSYKSDGDLSAIRKRYSAKKGDYAKEFPMRAAVLEAIDALRESSKLRMYELQSSPITPQRKEAVRKEQGVLSGSALYLEEAWNAMKEADTPENRGKETSRRWQANYDYTLARLQSRRVYVLEYNYVLGAVRRDEMPDLVTGQDGWRIGTNKKITVPERMAKDLAKATKTLWDKIINDYPDTPWALFAMREREISLGLQWRPKSN